MPIVSLNKVTVIGCTPEEYERVYQKVSDFMATQPGHISQRLIRSSTEPNVYVAIAEWESLEHYRALGGNRELVEIFGEVITLPGPPPPEKPDKIVVEHHDGVVVSGPYDSRSVRGRPPRRKRGARAATISPGGRRSWRAR